MLQHVFRHALGHDLVGDFLGSGMVRVARKSDTQEREQAILDLGANRLHPGRVGFTEIQAEALKLSPEDQARLLHRLAMSLDAVDEPELTNDELQKRWAEFEVSGEGIEASQLHERAKRRYGL
jgi:hypothetical protein